jgi:HlyD family secretion protein
VAISPRRRIAIAAAVLATAAAAVVWLRHGHGEPFYTGFVEGEERVLRSEVAGRVLEVAFAEGDAVPAGAVVARIDTSEIDARIASGRQQVAVLDAEIARQEEQVDLSEKTWRHDVDARRAELDHALAEAGLATATFKREQSLLERSVISQQRIDEARAQHEQTESSVARARELLRGAEAQEGSIRLARHQLEVLRQQRTLAETQVGELEVQRAKHEIRAPAVATVVQTQLLWPGELAQPGTPILSVLDPRDKYVQIYVPVSDVSRVRLGRRVEIELDSQPGRRVPGEVSFVADQANFTPEKIETRSDRLGQVYRAKVRILEGVEEFQPGTEGNVYLMDDGVGGVAASGAARSGT